MNDPAVFNKIEYAAIWQWTVGSLPVVIGRILSSETDGPVIYGAALSERDLRHESCGYGATEAEAVADLFRHMR